jgi:hypothetical protein
MKKGFGEEKIWSFEFEILSLSLNPWVNGASAFTVGSPVNTPIRDKKDKGKGTLVNESRIPFIN